MFLLIRGFHDLGQRGAIGSPDQIFAPLLSARGVLASLVWAGLAAFFPTLASLFREAMALPPLAAFWSLGAPLFWLAPFFEEVFSDVRALLRIYKRRTKAIAIRDSDL